MKAKKLDSDEVGVVSCCTDRGQRDAGLCGGSRSYHYPHVNRTEQQIQVLLQNILFEDRSKCNVARPEMKMQL